MRRVSSLLQRDKFSQRDEHNWACWHMPTVPNSPGGWRRKMASEASLGNLKTKENKEVSGILINGKSPARHAQSLGSVPSTTKVIRKSIILNSVLEMACLRDGKLWFLASLELEKAQKLITQRQVWYHSSVVPFIQEPKAGRIAQV